MNLVLFLIPYYCPLFIIWSSLLHLHLEDDERRSQPYSYGYYWLGPDLKQNTQGQQYPNIPGGFNLS